MEKENDQEIETAMQASWEAFHEYRKKTLHKRSQLLKTIALEIEALGDELIHTCMEESNLPEARLKNERTRTIFQLNNYAEACAKGTWMEVRIDTEDKNRTPPKIDIRKMLVPLGPVVVFGASNFPFAYSTAGGDTATAFAAGCSVIVKGHPAHRKTSMMVANAIHAAVKKCKLPSALFTHFDTTGNETGKALAAHPFTKAIGFTGSFAGGEAIWKIANARKEPIPVFAEMSSINPVFLLPKKLKEDPSGLAKIMSASVTLGAGQFCTNPGLIIGIEGEDLQTFIESLSREIKNVKPVNMLHEGIAKNFKTYRSRILNEPGVALVATSDISPAADQDYPTIAIVSAHSFLQDEVLKNEVFGSFSLVIKCRDKNEMLEVARNMHGQLTSTIMGNEDEIKNNEKLLEAIKDHCGRLIFNNVPTGVEVCLSMHHGGPWPSTTSSHFTSVGADAIKRFTRPLCFQNWPDELLPDELKNQNTLSIWRTVDNELTKEPTIARE